MSRVNNINGDAWHPIPLYHSSPHWDRRALTTRLHPHFPRLSMLAQPRQNSASISHHINTWWWRQRQAMKKDINFTWQTAHDQFDSFNLYVTYNLFNDMFNSSGYIACYSTSLFPLIAFIYSSNFQATLKSYLRVTLGTHSSLAEFTQLTPRAKYSKSCL
jgi:hypothetical protein